MLKLKPLNCIRPTYISIIIFYEFSCQQIGITMFLENSFIIFVKLLYLLQTELGKRQRCY